MLTRQALSLRLVIWVRIKNNNVTTLKTHMPANNFANALNLLDTVTERLTKAALLPGPLTLTDRQPTLSQRRIYLQQLLLM